MRVGILMFIAMSVVFTTGARAVDYLVDEPGRWKPWKFLAEPRPRKLYDASSTDVKAFEKELCALDDMIRHASSVAQPRGFNAETRGRLSEYTATAPNQPKGAELPLGGTLTFGAFPIVEYRRNGKFIRKESGKAEPMRFVVNNIQPGLLGNRKRPGEWKGVDTDAFLQPAEGGTVAGFPRYGNYILIKKRHDPLWIPVSVEDALRLVIASMEKRLDHLKRMRGPAKEIRKAQDKIAGVEIHIASLRPEDRVAPACWTGLGEAWGQRFQIGKAPDCRPLVRPNWAFFDRHLPRSAPQVLLVTDIDRCLEGRDSSSSPAGCATNLKLLNSLNRDALLGWLH